MVCCSKLYCSELEGIAGHIIDEQKQQMKPMCRRHMAYEDRAFSSQSTAMLVHTTETVANSATKVTEMQQSLATGSGVGAVLQIKSVFYGHAFFLSLQTQPFGCSLE